MSEKALVLFSGGVDSTTCLGLAIDRYGKENVIALSVSYGQKHEKEIEASRKIAEYFHISQSYLCKLFHENGTTVTTVIQEIRLQQTRSLLEQSDLSIQNIAELVGYHDLTYFIKLFKRNFSITPYQYRKKYQSAKNLSQSTES